VSFPDGEEGVAALLETVPQLATPGVERIFFRTPEFDINNKDLYDAHVPFAVIRRIDGAANSQGWQQTEVIEVETFAASRAAAKQLNQAVRAVLACPEGADTPAGFFDRIEPSLLPNEVPYEQDDARRDISNWAVVSRNT
jgi:hypothetical protein